jgi:hypothetical protein
LFFGKAEALLSVAISGVIVFTKSSIFTAQAFLKQFGHKQSTTSEGTKIGGKLLHQHLFPSGESPQLNAVPQLEQFFTLRPFILQRYYLFNFLRLKVNKKFRNCATFVAIQIVKYEIVLFKIRYDIE